MKTLVDIQIAARSLAQHRKRTLFLGIATAAVTGLLVLMNGLTDGINATMLHTASTLMTGHVNVGGFYKPTASAGAPLVLDYQKVIGTFREKVPELEYMVVRGRGYAKSVSETASMDLVLGGIDITAEPAFRQVVRLIEGNLDELAQPNTVLIFQTQAKRLGVGAGDMLTLSAPIGAGTYNTADVRVVGVAHDIGLLSVFNAYMQADSLRTLYQLKEGSTGAVQLYLKDHTQAPQIAARLRSVLSDAGYRVMDPDPQAYFMKLMMKINREDWTGQKLDVSTWEDEMSFMSGSLKVLNALTLVLIVVLSVIIVVGVMNTMWIAIRERTREIGTLRAIGMHRRSVLKMFMLESLMLGLLGSTVGAVAAAIVAWLVNLAHIAVPEAVQMFLMTDHLALDVRLSSMIGSIIALTMITAIAAFYPSIRAARLKPVTAMHHIG